MALVIVWWPRYSSPEKQGKHVAMKCGNALLWGPTCKWNWFPLPVLSAFALSTFQPSLPQVKMQEHQCFACKSLKFKHTAYTPASLCIFHPANARTHTHTPISLLLPPHTCTENPPSTLLNSLSCIFPQNARRANSKWAAGSDATSNGNVQTLTAGPVRYVEPLKGHTLLRTNQPEQTWQLLTLSTWRCQVHFSQSS